MAPQSPMFVTCDDTEQTHRELTERRVPFPSRRRARASAGGRCPKTRTGRATPSASGEAGHAPGVIPSIEGNVGRVKETVRVSAGGAANFANSSTR